MNVEDQLADGTSLLNTTRKLIRLRKSSHALCADGEIEFLNRHGKGYPLVYRRSGTDGSYLICINPTAQQQTFPCRAEGAVKIMENAPVIADARGISLPPVSFAIFKEN